MSDINNQSEAQNLPQGITAEDHGLLNILPRPMFFEQDTEDRGILILQMRERYKDNPFAQEEIDSYDPKSPYFLMHKKLMIAMKNRDYEEQSKLEEWFLANYSHVWGKYE